MTNLAIKGHATRGSEVIEILEMLGGKNIHGYVADSDCFGFYIGGETNISYDWSHNFVGEDEAIFTLEEFLEKFPYKVGDKVTHNIGIVMNVVRVYWDAECNVIRYDIQSPVDNIYKFKAMLAEHLQPYKEETMEEKNNDNWAKWDLPDGYEFQDKDGNIINTSVIKLVKKQSQYPKTYEECCEVLGIDVSRTIGHSEDLPFYRDVTCYENNLLSSLAVLRKLLICRDAYWKIAGEQMGLGKPWKPDWTNHEFKHCIKVMGNTLECISEMNIQCILAFPTPEMRDAFKENFDPILKFVRSYYDTNNQIMDFQTVVVEVPLSKSETD